MIGYRPGRGSGDGVGYAVLSPVLGSIVSYNMGRLNIIGTTLYLTSGFLSIEGRSEIWSLCGGLPGVKKTDWP